ncbi:hypothetical protein [Streptomyces lasiicapitis]|uniref:hypothetical protein n=1 Tax=Streptomyces lasiicapitis TaxID=1923961 RepID=UPI0036591B82
MADEHYKWLDRDAAERLLRGERLDGIGDHEREQAERLTAALGALRAPASPAPATQAELPGGAALPQGAERTGKAVRSHGADCAAELPGEAAALAAFRAARAVPAASDAATTAIPGTPAAAAPAVTRGAFGRPATAAGTSAADEAVRIGCPAPAPRAPRTRWARPVRFGVAAALAACMVGGVAVAAGTGVIPSPFQRTDRGPATSASPIETPEQPLSTPSDDAAEPPDELPDDESSVLEDDTTEDPGTSAPPKDTETPGDTGGSGGEDPADKPGTEPGTGPGTDEGHNRGDARRKWYKRMVANCQAYRSGELQGDKRRRLEEFAKGAERAQKFCDRVLDGKGGGKDDDGHGGGDDDHDGGGEHSPGDGQNGGGSGGVPPIKLPAPLPEPSSSYSILPAR